MSKTPAFDDLLDILKGLEELENAPTRFTIYHNGDTAEDMGWNRYLTDDDKARMMAWAKDKYRPTTDAPVFTTIAFVWRSHGEES